jgi:hypothetical protein
MIGGGLKHYRIHYEEHDFVATVERASPAHQASSESEVTVKSLRTNLFCTLEVSGKTIKLRDLLSSSRSRSYARLVRGAGALRVLVTACLLFTIHMFPKCKSIILSDESSFECSSAASEKGIVGLAEHNLLVYGSSWYQRIIPGLSLSTKRNPDISMYKYRAALSKLTSHEFKSSLTFEQLWEAALKRGSGSKEARHWLHEKHNPELFESLRTIYNSCSSLQTFFLQVQKTDRKRACRFFLETIPQIKRFIALPALLDSIWECKVTEYVQAMTDSGEAAARTAAHHGLRMAGPTFRVTPLIYTGRGARRYALDGLRFVTLKRVFPSLRLEGGGGRWPHRYQDMGSPD